ncbi:MAG: hypothetical protein HRT61_05090 [Ekhidna sp.]|nr:hypothetical protein [Ekhidna sp.]
MKRDFLVFLTFFSVHVLLSQSLSVDQVKEDLNQLYMDIVSFNPGLYKYNPNFDSRADSLISSLKGGDYNKYQAYTFISQLCALSNEGHFEIGQWSDDVHAPIITGRASFLPFSIFLLDDRIYIEHDMSAEASLEEGAEILEINGRKSAEILKKLRSVTPSDGSIQTYQTKKIAYNFPWFYFFYLEQSDSFNLTLRQGDQVENVLVAALDRDQRIENFKARTVLAAKKEPSIADFYELKLEDEYAYLRLKSFDYRLVEKYKLKGSSFYQDIFGRIAGHGKGKLIVDLRGNMGGRNEFGDEIVPFIYKNEEVFPYLLRNTSWKGKTRYKKIKKASRDLYQGDVYVMVDGNTYSTGAVVAWALRELNGAVFIGEETGTRYEGFVAGSKQYTTLTNSQIRVGVPCYVKEFATSKIQETTNRGLIPDHVVKASVEDVLEGRDPVMEFTLKIALDNQK